MDNSTTLSPDTTTLSPDTTTLSSDTTTLSPDTTETGGLGALLWLPYVLLTAVLTGLACASFMNYHMHNRDRYKDAAYKRKNHNRGKLQKKYRVTLSRRGQVCSPKRSSISEKQETTSNIFTVATYANALAKSKPDDTKVKIEGEGQRKEGEGRSQADVLREQLYRVNTTLSESGRTSSRAETPSIQEMHMDLRFQSQTPDVLSMSKHGAMDVWNTGKNVIKMKTPKELRFVESLTEVSEDLVTDSELDSDVDII